MRNYILLTLTAITLWSCGGKTFTKSPVDILVRDYSDKESYAIILQDMDVEEQTFSSRYLHQYKIIFVDKGDSLPQEKTSSWYEVKEPFFWKNENNMGMALATKNEDGTVSKVASPPGHNNYVGNPRYGSWNSGGFWQFYGQYAFMSSMFGMMSRPVYYNDYNNYRQNYQGRRPYYGSNTSKPTYGTKSAYAKKTNPNFFQRKSTKSGWNRSAPRSFSGSKSSGTGTSRYNSSGGFRRSGGGFGK